MVALDQFSAMLEPFLREPGTWTIVTEYIAEMLRRGNPDLCSFPLANDIMPPRTTHLVSNRYAKPWIRELTDEFVEFALQQLSETGYVTVL